MTTASPKALYVLLLLSPVLIFAGRPQAVIEDSGSTNRPGMRVTFDSLGHSIVEGRDGGEARHIKLPESMCARFMKDVEGAKPLDNLPKVRCIKSVSFGSTLFVEFDGARSPDLSCPATEDARSILLRNDAGDILKAARQSTGIGNRRLITVPVAKPPQ